MEEQKINMIPPVMANEQGVAQTLNLCLHRVVVLGHAARISAGVNLFGRKYQGG